MNDLPKGKKRLKRVIKRTQIIEIIDFQQHPSLKGRYSLNVILTNGRSIKLNSSQVDEKTIQDAKRDKRRKIIESLTDN